MSSRRSTTANQGREIVGSGSDSPGRWTSVSSASCAHASPSLSSTDEGLRRVRLFGLDMIDAPSLDVVVEELLSVAADPTEANEARSRPPIVVTPNVDIIVMLREAKAPARSVFERARWVLPDGMPIVAASRLLGDPLGARLTGSDLFARLWPHLMAENIGAVAVCADNAVAEGLARDVGPAQFVIPPILDPTDAAALAAVIDDVETAVDEVGAAFVFFGLGHPRDALLADELCRRRFHPGGRAPVCVGVGGAMAMHTGLTPRAPRSLQRLGLEWFYRFAQEPRRLFRRYFVRDLHFLPIVLGEARARRSWSGSGVKR